MTDFLNFDHRLLYLINDQWSSSFFDSIFPNITDLHKNLFFVIGFIGMVLFLFIKKQGKKRGGVSFLGLLIAISCSDVFATYAIKNVVQRERPSQQNELQVIQRAPGSGFSFPSNHATNMFTLATFVYASFSIVGLIAFVLAALIAYSRVYCGVHFPSDVLFGAFLGVCFGMAFSYLTALMWKTSFQKAEK